MAIHLDDEEKGILKYLGRRDEDSVTLNDITRYLDDMGYGGFSKREAENMLDHLIEAGYIRSRTEKIQNTRQQVFYLSRVPLAGGKAKQKRLQGRGIIHDTSSLIRKLLGSVFLLMGLGLFAYEGPKLTGAVIGVHTGGFFVGGLFIFIALVLFFFNPKKNKK